MTLQIKNHLAMASLAANSGTHDDWSVVCGALNVALVMCGQGVARDALTDVQAGLDAHAKCGVRLMRWGKLVYESNELALVNRAMDIHDAQVTYCTVAQLEAAWREVDKRMTQGKFTSVKEMAHG